MPAQRSRPKASRASWAVRKKRQATMARSPSTKVAPTNPSCSPIAVKMKSVCCSGTYPRFVSTPCQEPLPHTPPEPMASLACWRL